MGVPSELKMKTCRGATTDYPCSKENPTDCRWFSQSFLWGQTFLGQVLEI